MYTSCFATTHVVVFLWVCKTSYHLLISPPLPTSLIHSQHPITRPLFSICHRLKILHCWRVNPHKIACNSKMWQQYTRFFPAIGLTIPDVFQLKTFLIPRGIIPQKINSSGLFVSEELGNKHTNSLTSYYFLRVMVNTVDELIDDNQLIKGCLFVCHCLYPKQLFISDSQEAILSFLVTFDKDLDPTTHLLIITLQITHL